MRGIILLLLAGLLIAGCTSQQPPVNSTVSVNSSNNTTQQVAQCSGPVCGSDGNTYPTDCDASVANVKVAYNGSCVQQVNCTSTTSGIKMNVSATVTLGNQTNTDYCIDKTNVVKYTCFNNTITVVNLTCSNGEQCSAGRCIPVQNQTNVSVQSGCVGPSEPNMNQSISVTLNGVAYNNTCTGYDTVRDYYCNNNQIQILINQCDPGYSCDRGACAKEQLSCTSTVNSTDYSAQGTTIETKGINTIFDQTDQCIDDGTLQKTYCDVNGTGQTENVLCPAGTKCAVGHCVQSRCSDTDGAITPWVGGEAVGSDNLPHYDYCIDNNHMEEYYCYGDNVISESLSCPGGSFCNRDSNACVNGSITSNGN